MREEHYQQDSRLADDAWWWSARRAILERVIGRFITDVPQPEILEVGCSTGSNLGMLSGFGKVSALEISDTAAAECRERFPSIPLFRDPIPAPLGQKFQIICAFDVIEHIEDEEITVKWLHDHLNEGGLIFVTVPAMQFLWSQYDVDAHHYRRYDKHRLEVALSERFSIEYMTYFNTHLFPPIALVRMLQRAGILNLRGKDKEIGSGRMANSILREIFAAEKMWIPHMSLPFGVSLLAVARKPGPRPS